LTKKGPVNDNSASQNEPRLLILQTIECAGKTAQRIPPMAILEVRNGLRDRTWAPVFSECLLEDRYPVFCKRRKPGVWGRIFRYKYQHANVFEPIVGDIMWISFAAPRYFEVKEFDRFERKNPHCKG
jgi:hypothetical protein